jgi:hypothetical protein
MPTITNTSSYPSIQRLPDNQDALELAVKRDDHVTALSLLKQGADPYERKLRPRSPEMRAALEFPRRQAKVYRGVAGPNGTELDRALWEGRLDDAKTLLSNANPKPFDERIEVQRACILLGKLDSTVGHQLGGADIQHPQLRASRKESPYLPAKRGFPIDRNGKVDGILCRHFTMHQLRRRANVKSGVCQV